MKNGVSVPSDGLVNALDDLDFEPELEVTARMDGYPKHGVDDEYKKKELARLRKEVKAINDKLAAWDAEEVSAKAQKALKADLAAKKGRLMEMEALLGEDGEGEVGAKGKGSVVGGPYEIVRSNGKHVVRTIDGGHVKGKHDTRDKALRQFRLLEEKYHAGEKK